MKAKVVNQTKEYIYLKHKLLGMSTFIQDSVQYIIASHEDLSNLTLVMPGKRPMIFYRQAFANEGYSGILPKMQSIEDFTTQQSGLVSISGLPLLFEFYEAYTHATTAPHPFDKFIKWGVTLLKDFDDLDSALVKPKEIFDYLISVKRIEQWADSEMEVGQNELMQNHLSFWKIAAKAYFLFKQKLLKEGKGYGGLIAREAFNKIQETDESSTHYIFLGFNALTKAENEIFKALKEKELATFLWDSDEYYMLDGRQEAGNFLRKIKQDTLLGDDFKWVNNYFVEPKKIKVVEVSGQINQAKYAGQLLEDLLPIQNQKVALVLADENLLPAVLNGLPESIEKVNITMGLALKNATITGFFKAVFTTHFQYYTRGEGKSFYYKSIVDILQNSTFHQYFQPLRQVLLPEIQTRNLVLLPLEFIQKLDENDLIKLLIKPEDSPKNFIKNLIEWIDKIQIEIELDKLTQEYLFRFKTLFTQLLDMVETYDFIKDYDLLQGLFKQIIQTESVAFIGEPLVGLQLLGMLETRLLDFDTVIVCSVNEGVLPLGRQENSFIPFDIRKMFNMNTFLDNDAIYAYHFYHLLQRTKNIHLIYNTEKDDMGSGEPSRFIRQIDIESPHKLDFITASPKFENSGKSLLVIPKSKEVLDILEEWKNKGISVSSLNSYIRNPLQFYHQKVLKVQEEASIEEIAEMNTLGDIVHQSLENLYTPYIDEILSEQILKEILKQVKTVLDIEFSNKFGSVKNLRGKNIIIYSVAEQMIKNLINHDSSEVKEGNEIIIKDLEAKYRLNDYVLPNGLKVSFNGIIDRIDQFNGDYRILDFKTGSIPQGNTIKVKVDALEDFTVDAKHAKAIQLCLYALLFLNLNNQKQVYAGIIPLRNSGFKIKFLSIETPEISLDQLAEPLKYIADLIQEILDPSIDFTEKEV